VRLMRLEADNRLMLRLQHEGFEGSAWEEVARALAEYGFAVMVSWIRTGGIFAKVRERGFGGSLLASPRGGVPIQEARDIAEDTVAEAIVSFREHVLKTARWDPGKGASLATYFVGNCLLRFPNVYRKWRRRWDAECAHMSIDKIERLEDPSDPAAEVVGSVAATELLRALDPKARVLVVLLLLGWTHAEIAGITNASAKSVESRLYRLRKQLGSMQGQGEGMDETA
jgi:DNA-directed RNA polymerase specialized sigma24 family protein